MCDVGHAALDILREGFRGEGSSLQQVLARRREPGLSMCVARAWHHLVAVVMEVASSRGHGTTGVAGCSSLQALPAAAANHPKAQLHTVLKDKQTTVADTLTSL